MIRKDVKGPRESTNKIKLAAAIAGTLLAANISGALAEAKKMPDLTLRTMGHFFAGGKIMKRKSSDLLAPGLPPLNTMKNLVGQAYVEYLIPKELRAGAAPIIFAHSGLNGMVWQTTVDGREGWDKYFARRGFPVYVIDPPGTGRAGFVVDAINKAATGKGDPLANSPFFLQTSFAWRWYDVGPKFGELGDGHNFGNQMATDKEARRQFLGQLIPGGPSGGDVHESFIAAMERIKEEYGPVIYVGWSGGAVLGNELMMQRPDLFKAVVSVEAANCTTLPLNSTDFDSPQPQKPVDPKLVSVYADTKVPLLNLNSEAGHGIWSGHGKEHCRPLVRAIKAKGGKASNAFLPDFDIHGNSHQMMSERNSDEVAGVILNWIEDKVLDTSRGSSQFDAD
ncbi:hypothetical protein ACFOWB_08540 [Chenggangzhangella methanolivorans]|uniref:hypothetical protein n=1 Tax=Chenggangzhangella methanolivorans TaxID=1437009 RepID=UPI003622053D